MCSSGGVHLTPSRETGTRDLAKWSSHTSLHCAQCHFRTEEIEMSSQYTDDQ